MRVGSAYSGTHQQPRRGLAAYPDQHRRQQRVEHHDRAGHAVDPGKVDQQCPVQGAKSNRHRRQHGAAAAHETRDDAVDAHLKEGGDSDDRRCAEHQEHRPVPRHEELAQPERHGEPQCQVEQNEVAGGQDRAFGVARELHKPAREATCPLLEPGCQEWVAHAPPFPLAELRRQPTKTCRACATACTTCEFTAASINRVCEPCEPRKAPRTGRILFLCDNGVASANGDLR